MLAPGVRTADGQSQAHPATDFGVGEVQLAAGIQRMHEGHISRIVGP
jgi:hypothetical protein